MSGRLGSGQMPLPSTSGLELLGAVAGAQEASLSPVAMRERATTWHKELQVHILQFHSGYTLTFSVTVLWSKRTVEISNVAHFSLIEGGKH